ncbi:MAG: hypothetical protein ABIJ53_01885 [Verrucomicrobiota bacterium]
MSLIQDALKRQQEESESSRVPLKAAVAPSVPDAMPVLPSPPAIRQPTDSIACPQSLRDSVAGGRAGPEKAVQPGKSWKWIAGIIIFCVLIAWSGVFLVSLILKQSTKRTLLDPFMPDLTKAQATLGKSSVQAPPPAAQPPATTMSKPVVTPAPARASASKPLFSPAAAAAPAFADKGEDVEEDLALPGVKEQIEPAAIPIPVVWPRLKLSAIFSNVGSGQSGARLNNRLILMGDQIEGVTLVEIHGDSVVLKCGKETRSLKMGMTLN